MNNFISLVLDSYFYFNNYNLKYWSLLQKFYAVRLKKCASKIGLQFKKKLSISLKQSWKSISVSDTKSSCIFQFSGNNYFIFSDFTRHIQHYPRMSKTTLLQLWYTFRRRTYIRRPYWKKHQTNSCLILYSCNWYPISFFSCFVVGLILQKVFLAFLYLL